MRKIELEEQKSLMLALLRRFDAFCAEHGLRYFLSGGTLLGAVRHQGFIPWDDDIDVMMPRPDYERLLSLCGGRLDGPEGYIDVLFPQPGGTYLYPFAKLADSRTVSIEKKIGQKAPLGVYADIFPIDGLPSGELATRLWYARMEVYKKLHQYASLETLPRPGRRYRRVLRRLLVEPARRRGAAYWAVKMDRLARRRPLDRSTRCGVFVWGYARREIMDKAGFFDEVRLPFEGGLFAAPARYDDYLRSLYGEYRQLPPAEQRVCHDNLVYWKEGGAGAPPRDGAD